MENIRSKAIVKSGYIFIATNFLLAVFNLVVGLLSNSLSITSDAAHSLIDAVSGFIVVISEKVLKRKKYAEKRDKIERITTIILALIIILAGIHIVIEAIEKLTSGESEIEYTLPTILVLVGSIGAKLALAIYLKRQGKQHRSSVLSASSAETFNDMMISIAVLISVIVYLIWHVDIEAYISLAISLIIFKIGLEFIFPHLTHHHHHPLESDPDHDHCGHND
ncbi:cation diffusion facilitator family transporter [Candidatus Saccharibacteria bacterium]|nr:cation diffusion facilitator family transporter [Candidatus Saccharibacteria bacterium]